jgi:short-subunit dehydrogenase
VIEPEEVATKVVEAVERGKGEVTVPWFPYRLVAVAQALFPSLVAALAARETKHRDE